MMADQNRSPLLAICTTILVVTAMYLASSVFAPMAFALFAMALVWPLQKALQRRLPTLVALAIVIVVCATILWSLGSAVAWCGTRIVQYLVANAARFQSLYQQKADWLAQHGIYLGSLAVEYFDVAWLIKLFQGLTIRLQGLLRFAFVTFIFLMLGLLEVGMTREKLAAMADPTARRVIIEAATQSAAKFRRYMLVRALMSMLTGLTIWGFARVTGLELALEWGVIAFTLNFIPFVGPLVATLLPTGLAVMPFASIRTVLLIFACLNVIQFIIGSYIEPRIAGATLSLSPFLVLFAVFFGSFLWGLAGAFLGVPILIAIATTCAQFPSTTWVADLLAGTVKRADAGHLS